MSAPTYIESIGNTGYVGLEPEVTIGTPVTPTNYGFMTDETLQTNGNLEMQTPIAGQYMDTFQVLPGLRSHGGDLTIVADPNTSFYMFDMHMQRGTPVTLYTFTISSASASNGATYTNNGNTYTVVGAISSSTTLVCTGPAAPTTSGTLTYVSGTPTGNITYSAFATGTTTWPFILANPTKSYTIDIPVGQGLVKRFWGCMADGIAPSVSKNQIMLKGTVSALGSFQGRKLAGTPTGSNPYTVPLDTTYTQNPTLGLSTGDLIAFYDASNNIVNATVATVVDATHITTSTNVTGFGVNDFVYLRQATPTLSDLPAFLWSNLQFCPGATAAAALTASQTRLESGTAWNLNWPFESKDGSQRSGNADPASLVRLTAQPTFTAKKFFGSPQDIEDFNQLNKNAWQIRHFAYSGSSIYELRITFNHVKTDSPVPSVSAKKVNYSNLKFIPQYDTSDGQGLSVTLINSLNTIT